MLENVQLPLFYKMLMIYYSFCVSLKITGILIKKEEIELSLFAYDMILYIGNLKDSIKYY